MMRIAAGLLAAGLPGAAGAQPEGHIGQVAAEILVAHDCRMPTQDLAAEMQANGLYISDLQAQVKALDRGGYVDADADGILTLSNWEPCS